MHPISDSPLSFHADRFTAASLLSVQRDVAGRETLLAISDGWIEREAIELERRINDLIRLYAGWDIYWAPIPHYQIEAVVFNVVRLRLEARGFEVKGIAEVKHWTDHRGEKASDLVWSWSVGWFGAGAAVKPTRKRRKTKTQS